MASSPADFPAEFGHHCASSCMRKLTARENGIGPENY